MAKIMQDENNLLEMIGQGVKPETNSDYNEG